MSLIANTFSESIKNFIAAVNANKVEDLDTAIQSFAETLETAVYDAIRSLTITIPSGLIQVEGTSVAQTNVAPIILQGIIE